MILDNPSRSINNLRNDISPVSLSGHGVKKFGVLIPKLHNPLSESLLPVMILHSQKRIDVLLDDDPKFQFTRAQRFDFFQSIKESNCHITVSNKSRQVRKDPGPKFERSAEELEFSTDDMSTVANTDRRGPNRFDLIQTVRVLKPKIFKSENISLGNASANLDSTGKVIRNYPSKRKDH
jgi:hypothetical protein